MPIWNGSTPNFCSPEYLIIFCPYASNPDILDSLQRLLTAGEVSDARLADLTAGQALGLWASSADKKRAVATPTLVQFLRVLPSQPEAIAAILSCEPSIRRSWQQIVCARLQELGQQRDTSGLCQAIATLGQCAETLQAQMSQAKLASTPYTEIERSVFDVPAEQGDRSPQTLPSPGRDGPIN